MSPNDDAKPIDLATMEETISDHFPHLKVRSVQPIGEGRMNVTALVNEEWVFRFPKKQEGADDLEKEIRILPHLADYITLAIPQFEYVGEQKNGFPFVGYKILPGEILGEDAVPSLADAERKTIASQIAKFLDEMSAFPVGKARELGIPEIDYRKHFAKAFEEAKKKVFPMIDHQMQQHISSRFKTYLGNPSYFQYEPTLIHADLSPDHYLIDPMKRTLTGIIDFGDMAIGDPDYEYLYILEDCGEDFTRDVMKSRGQREIENRLKKIKHFVTFDHLAWILEGVDKGNRCWIREGIEAISGEMS